MVNICRHESNELEMVLQTENSADIGTLAPELNAPINTEELKQCKSDVISCYKWKNIDAFGKKGVGNNGQINRDPFCRSCKSKLRKSQYRKKIKKMNKMVKIKRTFNFSECIIIENPLPNAPIEQIEEALRNHALDTFLSL